jgi:hypothetical protein
VIADAIIITVDDGVKQENLLENLSLLLLLAIVDDHDVHEGQDP